MRLIECLALVAVLHPIHTFANTEKVIFVAPHLDKLPDAKPGADFLNLESITHAPGSLRTSLSVAFPSNEHSQGVDHWYLLRGLTARQRYELRVCWPAIQPTRFELDTYRLSEVFDDARLLNNLVKVIQRPDPKVAHTGKSEGSVLLQQTYESVLFLHIQAAADFFSPNSTLMLHPPKVDVDIILDPYIGNVFPASLTHTVGYLGVIATLGWLVSQRVWKLLRSTATEKPHSD